MHAKFCQLVVSDTCRGERYITQLSTGNYNEKTARNYVDLSMITYHQGIGSDVDILFEQIISKATYYAGTVARPHKSKRCKAMPLSSNGLEHVLASPCTMREELLRLINREAYRGADGRIFIKVNAITDSEIIEALMEASCRGCQIRMLVRGISSILPGITAATENISITSVVGRFLEHSRIYVFGTGRDEVMYISSADLMTRNLSKRIEFACPVYSEELRHRIRSMLAIGYNDNVKGRTLDDAGCYALKSTENSIIDSQQQLIYASTIKKSNS